MTVGILVYVNSHNPCFFSGKSPALGFIDSAYADTAGGAEDRVNALVEHLGGDLLTGSHVVEGTLVHDILCEEGDVGAQVFIGVHNTLLETPVEFLDGRNCHTADEAHFAFLQLEGCGNAGYETGLMLSEEDGNGIGTDHRVEIAGMGIAVEQHEVRVGIGFLSLKDGGFEFEARGYDELEPAVVEVTDFQYIVRFGGAYGLEIPGFDVEILGSHLNTFPGALVEGLVVNSTGVGNHTDSGASALLAAVREKRGAQEENHE
jgi:hypothetical protein